MVAVRRPLEVTIVVRDEVVPWRYPPRRELQFGEWLRQDLQADFAQALLDTLGLWNQPADWQGDERNGVLALARIWFSASTGEIAPKDAAAAWAARQTTSATVRPKWLRSCAMQKKLPSAASEPMHLCGDAFATIGFASCRPLCRCRRSERADEAPCRTARSSAHR